MRLTHTTRLANLPSIRKYGLLCTYAKQGRVAVWLHVARLDKWGEAHVKVRHGCESEGIVHLVLDVPRSWCRRHASGIWYCLRDIPPSRFRSARVVRTIEEEVDL